MRESAVNRRTLMCVAMATVFVLPGSNGHAESSTLDSGWLGYPTDLSGAIDAALDGNELVVEPVGSTVGGFDRSHGREETRQGFVCWAEIGYPTGYYDSSTNRLYAQIAATVACDFEAPWMSFAVQFTGYDGAHPGGFAQTGDTYTCFNKSQCRGYVFYNTFSCNGKYDHYGRVFGTYEKPDGTRHRIANEGQDGPHNTGNTFSRYC